MYLILGDRECRRLRAELDNFMWVLRLGPRPSVFSPTPPSLQPSSDGNKDQWPFYTLVYRERSQFPWRSGLAAFLQEDGSVVTSLAVLPLH